MQELNNKKGQNNGRINKILESFIIYLCVPIAHNYRLEWPLIPYKKKANHVFSVTHRFELAVTGKPNLVNKKLRRIEIPVKHLRWNTFRSSQQRCSLKKDYHKNSAKNIFFTNHLRMTASVLCERFSLDVWQGFEYACRDSKKNIVNVCYYFASVNLERVFPRLTNRKTFPRTWKVVLLKFQDLSQHWF